MGIVCCGGRNNYEIEIKQKIVNPNFTLKYKISTLAQLVTLLQSYYRRHLSIKRFKSQIESIKEEIFTQLDKKKLINKDIISECISEKIYQKYLLNGKIKSYMEIVNSNKSIKKKSSSFRKIFIFYSKLYSRISK